jgi:hypothetical protein
LQYPEERGSGEIRQHKYPRSTAGNSHYNNKYVAAPQQIIGSHRVATQEQEFPLSRKKKNNNNNTYSLTIRRF